MTEKVLQAFSLDSAPVSCEKYGFGHINVTYLVVTRSGRRYILQKINNSIFKDVPGLMGNIAAVTRYLRTLIEDERGVLTLVPTKEGADYYCHEDGSYWRVYDFVEQSICLQAPESPEDFYQSALAFGRFQELLSDYPAGTLFEIIPNFHNTIDRYEKFKESVRIDAVGRAAGVREDIRFMLEREELGGTLQKMLDCGILPLRVTHNDTKLNNVLLDTATRKSLCVLDLDTVMPGLSVYDFGDSIRFGAATAAEDEPDTSKMQLDLHLFEVFTRGFLEAAPSLTDMEVQMLPMGALIMTLEVALRFLTDYLDGDLYFSKIRYADHNLVRARSQMALVADMQKKYMEMNRIVANVAAQVRK